ncbi:MAG TPA: OsmC family protein [Steroidobacteraceae bacterium]|nr:OsmC family protein [Steroidobacteraceae bacterium]
MAHVTVISEFHYAQQIVSGRHRLTADEPIARGGSDSGVEPHELLLASLGACTSITLRMYAGRKGWELGKITVGLRYTAPTDDRKAHIDRRLSFSKPLTDEQIQRLTEIAGKTPVTRMLLPGADIDTSIAHREPA